MHKINYLRLSFSNRELTAVLWASKAGNNFHRSYPILLGMGIKDRANEEIRPLQRKCGRRMARCNFPRIHDFFPSDQL